MGGGLGGGVMMMQKATAYLFFGYLRGKGRIAYLWSSTHKITREREDAPSTIAFALGLAGACVDGMGAASVAFF